MAAGASSASVVRGLARRAVDDAPGPGRPPRLPGCLPARSGVGLKPQHFAFIVEAWPEVGFFEVHAENYLVDGGVFHHFLGRIRARYALSIHGVGLSIGGESPPDRAHLHAVRRLLDRYQPEVFSEHLAWSSLGGAHLNDLLPLPYNRTTLRRVCAHLDEVQAALGRRILLENPATYLQPGPSTLSEAEFLGEVVERTGCGLLVDVNNAYVSAVNHGGDARAFLAALPAQAIGELHLAGHAVQQDGAGEPLLIDHHGCAVQEEVWALYAWFLGRVGRQPTLIEWDNDVPGFARLLQEATRAEALLSACDAPAAAVGAGA